MSTAKLPDAPVCSPGYSTGMNLKDILDRVEARLSALGLSADGASKRAGKPDAIRNMRRAVKTGRGGPTAETVAALAPVLETTAAWLIEGAADDLRSEDVAASLASPRPAVRTVPVKGYVGAGAEAHFYAISNEDFEEVEAPPGATDRTIAVEIRGKSFGPLMDTWLVFYDDIRSPVTDDLIGRVCVVGLSDDRILIKKIVRNRDGGFDLLSNSHEEPIRDVSIEWAAKVTDMRPR